MRREGARIRVHGGASPNFKESTDFFAKVPVEVR
jgi:hypothetical protein